MNNLHLFTSITSNYIPKARVLANSAKRMHPEYQFHLMLCDELPPDFNLSEEPFDTVIQIADLEIPDEKSWVFKHNIVELCTAVKGRAAQTILEKYNPDGVIYFDPDIVIFSSLESLTENLFRTSILLTPHLTQPENSLQAILDNEVCALRHGIYNLGFLGVRNTETGHEFLKWWADRLLELCYDDKEQGIFTDQRWADLVPAFFEDYIILREPTYNVATWNLSHRHATGTLESGVLINGKPLCFYHFSGFDSGAQEIMLSRYGVGSPILFELRQWYIQECEKMNQSDLGKRECIYARFSNGEKITPVHRRLYKLRSDLQAAFPDPFDASAIANSYFHWYEVDQQQTNQPSQEITNGSSTMPAINLEKLKMIQGSRTWKLANRLRSLMGKEPFDLTDLY
jgi:lipopolysaccharide biosynthesis glycosyltransferase